MEKHRNIFWFVNISEYHQREMGLIRPCVTRFLVPDKNSLLCILKLHCMRSVNSAQILLKKPVKTVNLEDPPRICVPQISVDPIQNSVSSRSAMKI